jgi:hypothetical protein
MGHANRARCSCGAALLVVATFAAPAVHAENRAGISSLPAGRYRLEMRFFARAQAPLVGPTDTLTASVSRVDVRHVRGALVQEHLVCRMWDASATSMRSVIYPASFVTALPRTRVRPVLSKAGGQIEYEADLGQEWLGATPAATLPRDPDDPGVHDSDGDGLPGVTIQLRLPMLREAELLVTQRSHAVLRGRVVAPGRVVGHVEMRDFEQTVLATHPQFLHYEPKIEHDATRSSFELVRANADPCATRASSGEPAIGDES